MKYSYKLISNYITGSVSKEDMIYYLDLLGLNPLVISKDDQDVIFELEVPANKGYLLNIIGVAREILPFIEGVLKLPEDRFSQDTSTEISIKIENENDCPYYSCRAINDIKNINTPEYIKQALDKMGYRTSFNEVDISNFVMAETGQPLHIFDLDKIEGHICVRRGKKGESVILIDGKRREIDEDVLVIADSAKVVAIAGIMGCENSEVKENTKNILIESAVFAPYVIRKSSKKLGLTSDASLRFERGIDADTATNGMARTLFLIKETSQGKIGKLSSVGKKTEKIREVSIDIKKINKVLGVNVEEDFILSVLRKLDFLLDKKNKHFYIVKPPSYRNDIKEDVDIIEEVARYGDYSEIPSNMPISTIKPTLLENESKILDKIKGIAVALGFTEFINLGLTDERNVSLNPNKIHIPIENPISTNLNFLRSTLVPEIFEAIRFNIHRGSQKINIFEVGKVYSSKESNFVEELNLLFGSVNIGNFFVLKGKIEKFLQECGLNKISFIKKTYIFSEEDNTSIFLNISNVGKIEIGNLFIPSEKVKNLYDIKKEEVYICEFYLEKFLNYMNFNKEFKELPKFPSSNRDFSFIFSSNIDWGEIEKVIFALNLPIEKIEFFDTYKDKNLGIDNISISFSVLFRLPDKTFEASEISTFSDKIIEEIKVKLKGRLRSESTKR